MHIVKRSWGAASFGASLIFSTTVALAAEHRRHDPIADWFRLRYFPSLACGAITDLALRTFQFQFFAKPEGPPPDAQAEQKSWFAFALMNVLAHVVWTETEACAFSAFTFGCSLVWVGRGIICP